MRHACLQAKKKKVASCGGEVSKQNPFFPRPQAQEQKWDVKTDKEKARKNTRLEVLVLYC